MKSIYLAVWLLFIMSISSFSQYSLSQKKDETKNQKVLSGFFSFNTKISSILPIK
jgi:TM2 domain-containing membrane protein YozV